MKFPSTSLLGTLLLFFSVSIFSTYGQEGIVKGKVSDEYGVITGVDVYVKGTSQGTQTTLDGKYELKVAQGAHTIVVSYTGYSSQEKTITLKENKVLTHDFTLEIETNSLGNVEVYAKTEADIIKEKAFEVEVIETKELKNSTVDVNGVLEKIPGVNIRQSGGLGSSFDFSLNGLSGKKVKFFIDNIPVTNFGSSFSFNNFPVNLIERIEVYKGVVPINLGADALGGAINIVTTKEKGNFIDASYSNGSFNTHIAAINGQYVTKKKLIVKLSSFYNYSDNNYGIDDVVVRDELGNSTGELANNVKRFHDEYNSQFIDFQFGVVEKSYADEFLIGFTASANKNEIQHSFDPQNPFGNIYTTNNVVRGSVNYQMDKFLKNKLKLKIYASVAKNTDKVIDTSSYNFDWFGNSTLKNNVTSGELFGSNTLFEYKDDLFLMNASASYEVDEKSTVSVNFVKDYISRVGEDSYSSFEIPFSTPNVLSKNILGLAYDLKLFQNSWKNTFFGKGYYTNYNLVNEDLFADEENRLTELTEKFQDYGYGFATTYKFSNLIRVKASFEKTFRIPDGYELFGDGLLLVSNVGLKPEESNNYNFGVILNSSFNKFIFKFDGNFFHRNSTDFIRLNSVGATSIYQNVSNANSTGGEVDFVLEYDKTFFFNVNSTYQNIINKNTVSNSELDYLDNARIPNTPYFFGNLNLTKKFKNLITSSDFLSISWGSNYIHEFPIQSYVNGAEEERLILESQFSHDLNIGYSFNKGTYNLSLTATNITDENLYDNFRIQQPGRAFYLKFRYFLSN